MSLRRRLAEHVGRTSLFEDDEAVLREGAGLVRELADELRLHPHRTLADLAPTDDALLESFDGWRLNLVGSLAHAGLFELAVETAGLLRKVDPDCAVDHAVSLAVALAEAGRGVDAVRVAEENARAHPGDYEAWAGLAEVHRVLGDDEAAEAGGGRAPAAAAPRRGGGGARRGGGGGARGPPPPPPPPPPSTPSSRWPAICSATHRSTRSGGNRL
jgi:hypothetical protein